MQNAVLRSNLTEVVVASSRDENPLQEESCPPHVFTIINMDEVVRLL